MKRICSPLFSLCRRFYHKSRHTVAIPDCTVTDFIFRNIEKHGPNTALIDGTKGRSISFSQLLSEVQSVAGSMQSRGLQPGDVVCLCGSNSLEFVHALCAVTEVGAALTIANPQLTTGELAQQLKETNSKYLMVTEDCAEKGLLVQTLLPELQKVYVFGKYEGCESFSDLMISGSGAYRKPTIDQDRDVALIPFSSGTTGLPKGVMLSHRNLVAELAALNHLSFLPFYEGDSSLSVLPMTHIAGLVIGMLNPLSQGAPVVVMPRFTPDTFLGAIQKYRPTFSLIAPPVVSFLATDPRPDQYDLSSLTTPYSGAASLGKELTERVVERLGLTGIRQGYGMSEASPATHTTPVEGWKYGSIGVPLPNTESKIIDPATGESLGPNINGEIWVRGAQVMLGYLNNTTATADTLTQDGWLKTGDIGYYDEDGHYFVVDRMKEIIKYKGYQIAPAYLEAILMSHDSVADAAVVGQPHPVSGHVPQAFVVLKTPAQPDQLANYVNEQVAPYRQLRGGVHVVQQIPRSASGKILRRKLVHV